MNTTDKDEADDKKTVYEETDDLSENQTSGETSSASDLDRSAFSRHPDRKNNPLGASHEPGTTPGTE
jgi:hypothetical protein